MMALEDMEKTSFITLWVMYCYKVMPLGLKNCWCYLPTCNHHFVAWFDPQRSRGLCWWYDIEVQRPWRTYASFTEDLWKNKVLQVTIESKKVHFLSNIRKAIVVYCKPKRNRSWSWQYQRNYRDDASKNWKGDSRISGEDIVHHQVYSWAHHDMWTNLPTAQEGGPYNMEWTMPRSLWKDQ